MRSVLPNDAVVGVYSEKLRWGTKFRYFPNLPKHHPELNVQKRPLSRSLFRTVVKESRRFGRLGGIILTIPNAPARGRGRSCSKKTSDIAKKNKRDRAPSGANIHHTGPRPNPASSSASPGPKALRRSVVAPLSSPPASHLATSRKRLTRIFVAFSATSTAGGASSSAVRSFTNPPDPAGLPRGIGPGCLDIPQIYEFQTPSLTTVLKRERNSGHLIQRGLGRTPAPPYNARHPRSPLQC